MVIGHPAKAAPPVQIQTWMELAGMRSWTDAIGNVHGEIRGPDASAGAIVLGSHYDTVRDAGAYDGTLGIVTAVAAVKGMVLSSCNASTIASLKGSPPPPPPRLPLLRSTGRRM